MEVYGLDGCCGVCEIHGLAEYTYGHSAICAFLTAMGGPDEEHPPYYIFTAVVADSYGASFRQYIADYKLGEVVTLEPRLNPNSGNTIQAWMWAPNWDHLEAWQQKYGEA